MPKEVNILLIEDNPADAELITRVMKKHCDADKIKRLRNGEEAIEFLDDLNNHITKDGKNSLYLVVLALFLPKISGLEVLKHIKSSELNKRVPVVVFTSSEDKANIVESYNLNANSYVVKPTDYEALNQAVNKMIDYWYNENLYAD